MRIAEVDVGYINFDVTCQARGVSQYLAQQ